MKWKSVSKIILLCVTLSLFPLVFGQRSGFQLFRLKKTLGELNREIETQAAEREALKIKISQLETNPFSQMKAIREALGYVREGETVFNFVETPGHAQNR